MTREDLRTRILEALNDPDGILCPEDDANTAINDALEVIAEAAGSVKRTAFVPVVPGSLYYTTAAIAPDVMTITRVYLAGDSSRLVPTSIRELDARHERWADVTGTPKWWFSVSHDIFGVWPGSAEGGGVLRVDYLAWPARMLDDGDEPELAVADHDAITVYGVYEGLVKRWEAKKGLEAWGLFTRKWAGARGRTTRPVQERTFGPTEMIATPGLDLSA